MKKWIITILLVLATVGTSFAGHGAGGGGHGGGGRGNTYIYNYGRGGCGRGWYNGNAFWGSFGGAAAGALVAGILTAPRDTMYVQTVPVQVVPAGYVVNTQQRVYVVDGVTYYENVKRIIRCPNCDRKVDCTYVAPGCNAQCPICGTILY